jgi:hypothetical protein
MAWMLIALGILSTFGPASGSIEGMIYTPVPIRFQLRGGLEVVPQALLLSALLCYWVNRPGKKWLNWLLGIVFFIMMALPILACSRAADRSAAVPISVSRRDSCIVARMRTLTRKQVESRIKAIKPVYHRSAVPITDS